MRGKNKEARKEYALERTEVSNQRTPEEQLQLLDQKFGKGQGATRERLKLDMKIRGVYPTPIEEKKVEEEKAEVVVEQLEEQSVEDQDTESQYNKKGNK